MSTHFFVEREVDDWVDHVSEGIEEGIEDEHNFALEQIAVERHVVGCHVGVEDQSYHCYLKSFFYVNLW